MTEHGTLSGGLDRQRIRLSEDAEVRGWAARFGVTETAVRRAAGRVGPNAEDVRRELGGQRWTPEGAAGPSGVAR